VRSSMAKELRTPVYINTMGYGVQVYYERLIPDNPPKFQHICGKWFYYLGPSVVIDNYGRFADILPDGSVDKYFIHEQDVRYFPEFKEVL